MNKLTNLLKKGMILKCIKDFYMDDDTLAYVEGEFYKCEKDGHLTDEQHCDRHCFTDDCEQLLFEHFRPIDMIMI